MDVPRAARRIIIQAPTDPTKWPKPHPNTEAPRMATFTGVLHYDPVRRRSLTAVAGWRTRLASDGLAIPGATASRYDLYDDIGDDELEHRWQEALPGERLNRRFIYGLYGVRPDTGWWAVLYRSRKQLEALLAHGRDPSATRAVLWPSLCLGLDAQALEGSWPALSQEQSMPRGAGRWLTDPILHTPSALVHRLLVAGVAPITMMSSNLALIDRRAGTFEGVPWFAFQRDRGVQRTMVSEVTASGLIRRLGWLDRRHDHIVERCWGVSTGVIAPMRARGVRLPACIEELPCASKAVQQFLSNDCRLDHKAIASPSIEDALGGEASPLKAVELTWAVRRSIAQTFAGDALVVVGQLGEGPCFLQKPINKPIARSVMTEPHSVAAAPSIQT